MKNKNINVAPNLNQDLQKKVKLCEDSQCSTLINENSNLVEAFPTLSKIASKYLSKPSLRERFQLINETGNLKISKNYCLIQILSSIDSQLLFLKQRRESLFWPNIVKSCYDSSQLQITTRQLLEILTVWQQSYIINWERFEKQNGNYELLFKFPDKQFLNSQELNSRKELFIEKLESYLLQNGDFIEPYKLPQKPSISNLNIKQQIEIQSKNESVQFCQFINISKIFQNDDYSTKSNKPISNVSQKLIDKLRERKQQEKQKKEESQDDNKQQSKKQNVLVATMLHQYYQQRDVSNMFFSNVLKYIHEHNTSVLMSNDQIKNIIMNLIQSIENWLQLIDNSGGQILRVNKEMDLPNIINQLQ